MSKKHPDPHETWKKLRYEAQVEAVARAICKALGSDPDAREPGDVPQCDGRGYGNEKPSEYREPWHWFWRNYTAAARAAIKAATTTG